jgi:hypothetical protein
MHSNCEAHCLIVRDLPERCRALHLLFKMAATQADWDWPTPTNFAIGIRYSYSALDGTFVHGIVSGNITSNGMVLSMLLTMMPMT